VLRNGEWEWLGHYSVFQYERKGHVGIQHSREDAREAAHELSIFGKTRVRKVRVTVEEV
jgi:hypothetical protein